MVDVSLDERSTLDPAFAGNLLLATFDDEVRALIEPHAEVVELESGTRVQSQGTDVEVTYFPYATSMISLIVELPSRRSIEVASIGREGAVGGIVSCGHAPAFAHAIVQVSGPALKVPMHALEHAKRESAFLNNLFCRFSDYLLAQVQQTAACNAFHTIQQRAARWLLTAQDRAGDRLELTQEAFAGLLGVQRTTVNAVVRDLQDDGLINIRRGRVIVTDRPGLVRRACECYSVLEKHFVAVIGPSGSGGSPDC